MILHDLLQIKTQELAARKPVTLRCCMALRSSRSNNVWTNIAKK